MPSISFIYRIGNNKTTYFGKYIIDYLSDDHECLDKQLYPILKQYINLYRSKKNQPELKQKIHIGILSVSSDYNSLDYCSINEKNCFDFYLFENDGKYIAYINQQML